MPLILASNSASGNYNVANSLRFNSASSDELTRTPASSGNRQTWTWSAWVKRSLADTNRYMLFSANPANNNNTIEFNSNQLDFYQYISGYIWRITSTAVYRDVSAWYHIVAAFDSTQATAGNRVKVYINGVQITDFANSTYPAQNYNGSINNTVLHNISGLDTTPGYFHDGYMSEINFIDGQALDPTYFGQTDPAIPSSGIWIPKAYTGSYGTNGFYLKFANSAALGTDSSGNGNTWTVNNLTSVDQSTDTCTNNFATFNSIKFSGGDLTQGNLELDSTSASWKTRNSTIGVNTGKWFMEFKMGTVTTDQGGVAIVSDLTPDGNFPASDATRSPGIAYNSEGKKWVNGTGTASYFATMTSSDVIGIALDMDNGTVQFYRNGSTTGSPINLSDAFTSANYPLFFAGALYNTRDMQANFGSPPYAGGGYTDAAGFGNFSYAVPAGYYSLCTKNLANFG